MVNEKFEHFRREEQDSRQVEKKRNNKNDKPDTLFYKRFNPAESEKARLQLNRVEDANEQQEALKERFAELAILLESGAVDTNVDIAGERHWMQLDGFQKDGNNIDSDKLVKEVNRGQNLNSVSLVFNLEKTEQRAENLIIRLELPVTGVLHGGGELKNRLYEEITNIFAGSTIHDQSIRREKLENQDRENSIEQLETQDGVIQENLQETGAEISNIRKPDRITMVVSLPKTEKQVIISRYGNKLPWYISFLNKKNVKRTFITGQPGEILPEVTKFIEQEG